MFYHRLSIKLFVLFFILSASAIYLSIGLSSGNEQKNIVLANKNYIKESYLSCNQITIHVKTKCLDNDDNLFPSCLEQKIFFVDKNTNGAFSKIEKNSNIALDELAMSWACINGEKEQFLIIGYYNGGNCENCEWYEIFNLSGQKLASSKDKLRNGKPDFFEKTYKKLGLPKHWPRESFVNIPLFKND